MGKKHIIAVSYSFPPLGRPRGVQVYRLLNGLAAKGHDITLFHAEPYSALGSVDRGMLDWKVDSRIESISILSHNRNPLLRGSFRVFPWLRWLPDEFSSWIVPAYLAIKKRIQNSGEDAVLCTFSNPWSDHIIGAWLKRRFNLPWIAHFSDPWADNPYPYWGSRVRRMQKWMEHKVVAKTDRAIFVSEETRDLFIRSNGEALDSKSIVIPHIMEPDWPESISEKIQNGKLTITHTGDVYGKRSPAGLIQALQEIKKEAPETLARLRIQFVGNMEKALEKIILDSGLSEVITLIKVVPINESLRYMRESDVLMVLEGKSEGESVFLPSKLVEYLGSGNPIFGLTPLRGASAKVIFGVNGLVADPTDVASIKDRLLQLVREHKAGALVQIHRYGKEGLVKYTQENAAERFSDAVQEFSKPSEVTV